MTQLRWLKLGAFLLLITAVFIIILIARGKFDPQPVGDDTWQANLQTLSVPTQTQQFVWLDKELPAQPFSVQLTAVWQDGAPDSGYGLALGNDDQHLIIAVSPLGYATIQQNGEAIFPWQPWPHVKTGHELNEIGVDWVDGELTVRINRELMWGEQMDSMAGNLGIYGESFTETAVFDFIKINVKQ